MTFVRESKPMADLESKLLNETLHVVPVEEENDFDQSMDLTSSRKSQPQASSAKMFESYIDAAKSNNERVTMVSP